MEHNNINNQSSIISGLLNTKININMNSMSGINNDPTKPRIVLFGLICAHSFSLPKNFPTKYPELSVIEMIVIKERRYD